MSRRHNYSQYSDTKNVTPVVDTDRALENPAPETPVVEETFVAPEVKMEQPKTVTGTVIGCSKLNVRANPNVTANVVCVLDAASKVTIDKKKSTKDWVSVTTTEGIEGYCMRKYVEVGL